MIRAWVERRLRDSDLIGWPALIGSVFLLSAAIFFLVLSWGKWPDILVDFGRELYIPWQLSEGKVLYRDIYFYYGPFSKYLYAFFFRLFSPSLALVVTVNFIVLFLFSFISYRLLRLWTSVAGAWLAVGVLFSLFAFGQYAGIANYNFICPYSHELVHGLVLSFGILLLFLNNSYKPSSNMAVFWLGGLVGLVFLTKVEVFVALAVSLMTGGVLGRKFFGRKDFLEKQGGLSFLLGFFLPVLVAYFYFVLQMGVGPATTAFFFPYLAIFNVSHSANLFYQGLSGWDQPWVSIRLMAVAASGHLIIFGGMIILSLAITKFREGSWRRVASLFFVVFFAAGLWVTVTMHVPAYMIMRPLPLFCAALAVFWGTRLFLSTSEKDGMPVFARFVFAVFSTVLMLKVSLYGHIFHSGFVLCLPAALLLVGALFDGGSFLVGKWNGGRLLFQSLAVVFLLAIVVSYGMIDLYYYRMKTFEFGSPRGRFLTYGEDMAIKGPVMMKALGFLGTIPSDARVAVLPEGVILNYMSGHQAPTKYFEFSPSFFDMSREKDVLAAFMSSPPDYIVLVDRDMSEHGARYFGKDYARDLFAWMAQNYEGVQLIGAPPFSGKGFGILIGRRLLRQ